MPKILSILKNFWNLFLGFTILGLLIYGGYQLINLFINVFLKLDKQIAAAIIAAATTIIVSVVSVLLAKYAEQKKVLELENRNKKIPIYEDFIAHMLDYVLNQEKLKKENEVKEFLIEFSKKLIIWGSDEVLKRWTDYRYYFTKNSKSIDPKQMFDKYEALFLAIRKDIGHKNKKFKSGDILKIFINDVDNYVKN